MNAGGEMVATTSLFRSAIAAVCILAPGTAFDEWHTEGATKSPYAFMTPSYGTKDTALRPMVCAEGTAFHPLAILA